MSSLSEDKLFLETTDQSDVFSTCCLWNVSLSVKSAFLWCWLAADPVNVCGRTNIPSVSLFQTCEVLSFAFSFVHLEWMSHRVMVWFYIRTSADRGSWFCLRKSWSVITLFPGKSESLLLFLNIFTAFFNSLAGYWYWGSLKTGTHRKPDCLLLSLPLN